MPSIQLFIFTFWPFRPSILFCRFSTFSHSTFQISPVCSLSLSPTHTHKLINACFLSLPKISVTVATSLSLSHLLYRCQPSTLNVQKLSMNLACQKPTLHSLSLPPFLSLTLSVQHIYWECLGPSSFCMPKNSNDMDNNSNINNNSNDNSGIIRTGRYLDTDLKSRLFHQLLLQLLLLLMQLLLMLLLLMLGFLLLLNINIFNLLFFQFLCLQLIVLIMLLLLLLLLILLLLLLLLLLVMLLVLIMLLLLVLLLMLMLLLLSLLNVK